MPRLTYRPATCGVCSSPIQRADGASLKAIREAAGKAQGHVAGLAGCSVTLISRVERNRRVATDRLVGIYLELAQEGFT